MFKGPSPKHIFEKNEGLEGLIKLVPDFWNILLGQFKLTPVRDNHEYITHNYAHIFNESIIFDKPGIQKNVNTGNYFITQSKLHFQYDPQHNFKKKLIDIDIEFWIRIYDYKNNYSYGSDVKIEIGYQISTFKLDHTDGSYKSHLSNLTSEATAYINKNEPVTQHTIIELFNKLLSEKPRFTPTSGGGKTLPHTLKEYLQAANIDTTLKSAKLRSLIPYHGDTYISCMRSRDPDPTSEYTIPEHSNIEPFSDYKHKRKRFESKRYKNRHKDYKSNIVIRGRGNSRIPSIRIPTMRRVFPELIAEEIVGVQPMGGPVGFEFALRHQRRTELGRQLQATWTLDLAEDMEAMHGTQVHEEMVDIVAEEMRAEIDRNIIEELVRDHQNRQRPIQEPPGIIYAPYIPIALTPNGRPTVAEVFDDWVDQVRTPIDI